MTRRLALPYSWRMHQGNGGLAKTLDRLDPRGRLRVWIAANGLQQFEFADRIGIHESMLSKIIKGRREASPDIARKVEALTGGYVQLREDLIQSAANRDEVSATSAGRRRGKRAA